MAMAKLGVLTSIAALVGAFAFATLSAAPAAAGDITPCQHKDLKTKLAKDACKKGGQPAAKDAMKSFMKTANIKSCNQCHSKLAPSYDLKDDAFDQYKKAGGQ
jgi:hypothetical protein